MGESTTIAHALLTIAAIVTATVFATTVISRLSTIQSALSDLMRSRVETLQTNIRIIYVSYSSENACFVIYVKNVGSYPISSKLYESVDVYFGEYKGEVKLYVFNSSGGSPGSWSLNEYMTPGSWDPGETVEIRVYNSTSLSPPYFVEVVLPTGSGDEGVFTG